MKARKQYLSYFLFLITILCCWIKADSFSIDNPFPDYLYNQVLDTSMQIWEEIQLINADPIGLDEQTADDLLVGRLTRLQQLIQQLPKENMPDEDLAYLQSIIDKITTEYRGNNETIKNLHTSIPMQLHPH